MAEYKLSVIITTFNQEHIIDKTFDSVRNQNIGFENIEVIFVDDCSTDSTYEIIGKYGEEYDNVAVLKTEENSGFAGKPRNIGIQHATADYILFLDGDDQLLMDSCAVLHRNIVSTNADIAIGGHINRYENTRLEHISPMYFGGNEFFKDVINPTLFKIMPAICAKLFRREMLIENNISFPEGISGQDLVFLLTCMIHSKGIYVMNTFFVYYRTIAKNSITFNLDEKYFYGLIKAYSLICDLFEKHDIDIDLQKMLLTSHLGFFTTQVLRANSSEDFDSDLLNEILNSPSFDELSKKKIFGDDAGYEEYFTNMKNGNYNNHPIIRQILSKLDPKFNNEYSYLKDENNSLKNKVNNLESTNNELNEEISKLLSENENLKSEINEIKSSKLWRLKSKL